MSLQSLGQTLGGAHTIAAIPLASQDIYEIGHNDFLWSERRPVNKKAHPKQDGLFKFHGGDDGT
jgi:hypothetical protein